MFRKTPLSQSLLLAFGGAVTIAAFPAVGQQLERVEVTGSNIRRADAETSSPVQVITKQEIDQSGKGTVAEYLQTLTADGQGSVPFTYGRGFSGATAAGISLRGLGANATLVLLNGRRVAPAVLADDAQRSYVDLNSIPLEAVERVEVLKDGASAIYGSDAIAGVVNIILRKGYVGTVAKVTYGMSQKRDGNEPRVALTHGFGDLATDGYNVLLNAEFGKKDPIYYRDRVGRGSVGVSAIGQPQWGFDPNTSSQNTARVGGNGWIPVNAAGVPLNNSATPSIIGNVIRIDPATGAPVAATPYTSRGRYYASAQAYCLGNTNLPQNNTAGGCINDVRQQVNQIQPEHETANLFGRVTKAINPDVEAFLEFGYYQSKSRVDGLAVSPSAGVFQPNGTTLSQTAATVLGVNHPDNPFPGSLARLAYNPQFDTGISGTDSKSHSFRVLGGAKGVMAGFDFDTAISYSEVRQTDTATKLLDYRVKNALLNPTAQNIAIASAFSPAYAALPAGTVWRIGENAYLNSQAMYNALLVNKDREGYSKQYGADLKVSRELTKLPGGALGVAVGLEARHEENNLGFWDGLGNYQGLSLTSYGGKRDIYATYAELVAPVLKQLELNTAVRYDDYSDAGRSFTPKFGAKYRPIESIALRGTYARGFRAPSSAENSSASLAAFGGATVNDTARCAGTGVAPALCNGVAPTFLQSGNPDLKPEKSKSFSLGMVWDVTTKSSLTFDYWQIKRSGLPVIDDPQSAVDAGRVVRDPSTATTPTDPGGILNGFVVFQNSDESLTRGFDLEAKHRWDIGGGMGRLNLGLTWSRLLKQRVIQADGLVHEYAGTHGDCNITNCMGSPKDKVSASATWDMGTWRVGTNINYRGSMSNKFEESDTSCAQHLANGADFPADCKLKSFTTVDLSGSVMILKNTELFGSIANLFDKKPPSDFLTYGAIGYNPLDYSGAIGRYFRIGLKHKF